MPFVEVTNSLENWIRISKTGLITISKNLRDKYFAESRVRVFIDLENCLLGLQPSEVGSKINEDGVLSAKTIQKYNVKSGVQCGAEWNPKREMVIAKIALSEIPT